MRGRFFHKLSDGATRIGYNTPARLDARHGLGACAQVLKRMGAVLSGIAAAAGDTSVSSE